MRLFNYLKPLFPTRRDYTGLSRYWQSDVMAGLTVGIVALPLALAFGVSSGVGAEVGLVTAVIAGVIAAFFGGSNVQVSGPTGAMVVVLAPIVIQYGVATVALVSILAGIIVLIAGVLKIGRIVGLVPWPVIEGFTLGIAIIIFMQQVPAAFGNDPGPSTNALVGAFESIRDAHWAELDRVFIPLGIVIATSVIMIHGPKLFQNIAGLRRIPGSIIAIVVVTVPAVLFNLSAPTIGALPSGLPAPSIPEFDFQLTFALLGPALTVAALAGIESLLSIRVAAGLGDTGPYDGDRELIGQGLASIGAGFFGGMPATGAIARTAVNVRAGGKTRLSSIVHSLVLVLIIYLAAGVVSVIPLASLSGVLMVTAARMVSVSAMRSIVGSTKSDTFVYFLTALITVSFDLIFAVGIGIAVAGFFALRKLSESSGVAREVIPGTPVPNDERIALFRITGSLFFGASDRIMEEIQEIQDISVVILMFSQMRAIDATGAHAISELIRQLEARNITVLIKGVPARYQHIMSHVGAFRVLRASEHIFAEFDDALEHARKHAIPAE